MSTKRPARVSLRDVAQAVGVSTMAVSLALRGHGRVPAPTAQRIREAALRLGYLPNPKLSQMMSEMARTRHEARHGILAFVTTEPAASKTNVAEDKAFRAATDRAGLYGYQVQRFWLTDPALPADRLNQILWSRGIEGIIIPNVSGQLYAQGVHTLPIEWKKFCVIEIGGSMLKPAVNRVRHDHFGAMVKAIHRLERLGYRRIGLCLTREVDLRTHHRWTAAYLLWQAFRPEVAGLRPLLGEVADSAQATTWVRNNRIDAILSPGDEFLHALRAGGLEVPADVGFASLHIFGQEADSLTGVDQDDDLLTSSAVDMVVTLIQRHERGVPAHPTELLSTGHWQDGQTVRRTSNSDAAEFPDLEEQTLSF